MTGNYFDYERGTLVPNSLKVLKERHEEFLSACQVIEVKAEKYPKKWWAGSLAKSKADSLLTHLDHILTSMDSNETYFARYIAMKACVLYEAGTYLMQKYLNSALPLLRKAHELIWPLLPKSEVYWLYFFTVNNLAKVMKEKDEGMNAIQVIEDSIKIYEKHEMPKILFTCKYLFSEYHKIQPNKDSKKSLEDVVSENYQILISLYIMKCDITKYIRCEHFLLRRELDLNKIVSYDWIERAAVVAKILITENDFRNARHHLAVATNQFHNMLEKLAAKKIINKLRIKFLQETLSTAWIKYGLMLLNRSKQAIMNKYSKGEPAVKPFSAFPNDIMGKIEENDDLKVLIENINSEYSVNLLPTLLNQYNEELDPSAAEEQLPVIVDLEINPTILDQNLLLNSQDTLVEKFSDALSKQCYVDLAFPGQTINAIEKKVPRSLIETPKEATELFIFLLPWIDTFKGIVDSAQNPTKYASIILEMNELLKTFAFFQPEPKQQYELHKERQSELERLAWLMREEEDTDSLSIKLEVAKELSLVHYLLTQMNLKRVKDLKEEEEALKSNSEDIMKELLKT